MTSPSGEQIEIAFGDQRAVVVEVGGGLRAYSAAGRELLDGYPSDGQIASGRGQVLIPWPNRLQDGTYEFDGRRHQLPLTELEHQNAIHGLVRWAGWRVGEREQSRVVMEHMIHPQPGYPFSLEVSIEYALSDQGLSVATTATNIGPDPCPYGSGAHPYLTLGTADRRFDRPDGAGTSGAPLRRPRHTHGPGGGGRHGVRLQAAEGDRCDAPRPLLHRPRARRRPRPHRAALRTRSGLTLWMDEAYGYVMLFTGDPLPDVNRRSLAVEPMTCPPNAFSTGEAVIRLEPGGSFTSTWGLSPSLSP